MIKSLAAFAVFAVLGASVIALPWFAPKVEASEVVALAKADRLPMTFVGKLSVLTAFVAFAFVGAIVLGMI